MRVGRALTFSRKFLGTNQAKQHEPLLVVCSAQQYLGATSDLQWCLAITQEFAQEGFNPLASTQTAQASDRA